MPTRLATYVTVNRARYLDRLRRGVRLCTCGGEYQDTSDGRQRHRLLQGHTPTPADEGGAR